MNNTYMRPFPRIKSGESEDASFGILANWWEQLNHAKGERAALRRSASLTEVMMSPAFASLLRALRSSGYAISDQDAPLAKLAAIAGLCARIEEQAGGGLGERMGTPKAGGKTATLSELRLRRILACDDIEELYTLLRRALALLDDRANLADLAATIWHWSPLDEKRPHDPRRQVAYDYYAIAPIKS